MLSGEDGEESEQKHNDFVDSIKPSFVIRTHDELSVDVGIVKDMAYLYNFAQVSQFGVPKNIMMAPDMHRQVPFKVLFKRFCQIFISCLDQDIDNVLDKLT